MRWKEIFVLLLITIVVVFLFAILPGTRLKVGAVLHDLRWGNAYVHDPQEVDAVLADFEQVSINEVPTEYLKENGLQAAPFAEMCSQMKFYKIKKKDVYRKIAGNVRIVDCYSRDSEMVNQPIYSDVNLYWGMDFRVLHKLTELQQLLYDEGYDPDAMWVNSGHRHPARNKEIGGASKSRHILGEAIDLTIGDVNRNGFYSDEDKQIVLDMLEHDIIKDAGGVGLYPGTRAVHMDVRGYRARWNSY